MTEWETGRSVPSLNLNWAGLAWANAPPERVAMLPSATDVTIFLRLKLIMLRPHYFINLYWMLIVVRSGTID